MKGTIVRVCAWFTLIIFALTAIVGVAALFTEEMNPSVILAPLIFLLMSATGWYARKFGLSGFKTNVFSKTAAVLSLIFGILLIVVILVLSAYSSGVSASWVAIRNLLILLLPVIISAIAILTSKSAELKNN